MYTNVKLYSRPTNLERVNPSRVDKLLYSLLSLCTPTGYEDKIVNVIKNLDFIDGLKMQEIAGNLLIWVGEKQETLFSAHMDIVGEVTPFNKARNQVDLLVMMEDKKSPGYFFGGKVFKTHEGVMVYEPSTLGADDKVGCWLLLNMIQKKIPGLYVFHVGEEKGGIGSTFLVKNNPELFTGLKRAIAYDRAGYIDVIGSQRGKTCCSKEFGKALAAALNKNMPKYSQYKEGAVGSFTDTASYVDLIPECTNISCGYFNQHGNTEHLDYVFLKNMLLNAALSIDYDALPTVRDPKEKPVYNIHRHYGNYGGYEFGDDEPVLYRYTNTTKLVNSKRTTWKTATPSTFACDLPLWTPKIGFPEEAKREILIKAINHHIATISFKERNELSEYIADTLEMNALLQDECVSLQYMVDGIDPSSIDNKDEDKDTKGSAGELYDIEFHKRKEYLQKLAQIVLQSEFKEPYPRKFASSALKFLESIAYVHSHNRLSNKKLKKMNRLMFHLAYWLSLANTDNTVRIFLNDVADFINDHQAEGGYELNLKDDTIKKNLVTIIENESTSKELVLIPDTTNPMKDIMVH